MKEEIRKFALENAIKYNGKANLNAVLGKIFSSLKVKDKNEVIKLANKVIDEVNKLSIKEQGDEIKKFGGIKDKGKPLSTQERKTPDLENAKKGKVVMRFAPNPNGPLSFGHCRPGLWNWFLVKKYNGKYILRFDDTDPKIKVPMKEAYSWIKRDLDWLGVKPNKVVIQSKRLKIYYKYAEELIKKGYAYIDTIKQEEMRQKIWKSEISDEREEQPNEVMKKWKKMFTKYKEGEAVLRIKTDIDHPNPAVRDWIAFRIIEKGKHPLVKAKVWPLLNFASAIDDHELEVTHILRGVDLKVSDQRQKYIFDYFGWKYPETIYNGKFFVGGIKSTSEAKELIKEGKLTGWDDVRLGTIMSLRRRGFKAEAIINFIRDIGIDRSDVNISMDNLASYNKKIIDKKTNRYFLILNPKKIMIGGNKIKTAKIPLHPDFLKRGSRKINVKEEFYVQDEIKFGENYRFMHLFNFKNGEVTSYEHDNKLNAKLIHWLPVSKDLINVEVVMEDNSVVKGYGEHDLKKVKLNEIIQAERIGFMKLDKKTKNKMVFVFGHR
ncbi:glutamate--tRNA ligase [Candidatus Woesearchaeota archaeon]|nr:glutamate--tRNA ligase [Candidatus Woesearchaeota archaeon]